MNSSAHGTAVRSVTTERAKLRNIAPQLFAAPQKRLIHEKNSGIEKVSLHLQLPHRRASLRANHRQTISYNPPGNAFVTAFDTTGGYLYAAINNQGIVISTNGGVDWSNVSGVLPNIYVTSLTAIGPVLYTGTWGGGVYSTANYGVTWNQLSSGLSPVYDSIGALAALGTNLYAGCDPGGVYRSTNGGTLWTYASNGMGSLSINSFAVVGGNLFAATGGSGVFISTDSGATGPGVNNGLSILTIVNTLFATGDSCFCRWASGRRGLSHDEQRDELGGAGKQPCQCAMEHLLHRRRQRKPLPEQSAAGEPTAAGCGHIRTTTAAPSAETCLRCMCLAAIS